MDSHRGPFFYHAVGLPVLFVPWSVFLVVSVWYGVRATRRGPTPNPLPGGGAGTFAIRERWRFLGSTPPFREGLGSGFPSPTRAIGSSSAGSPRIWCSSPSRRRSSRTTCCRCTRRLRFSRRVPHPLAQRGTPLPKWIMPGAIAGLFLVAVGIIGALACHGRRTEGATGIARVSRVGTVGDPRRFRS